MFSVLFIGKYYLEGSHKTKLVFENGYHKFLSKNSIKGGAKMAEE